ncbi:MAG: prolipoprotein diacylglyceryl transferase [Leptothrix ochracea]|uniref:prolipoprotein diacylglyceryl transferase n=1 Tax=Leptothrix ochracea TaxID=735331 RepID=UPI0034E2DD90
MLVHPQFDPVALHLGVFQIHWYGLTYMAAFGLFYWLGLRRLQHPAFAAPSSAWTGRDIEDLLFYGVLGVVLGGRLGYVLFYKFDHYLAHPLDIFAIWKGGMAFHGGLLGVIVAMALFARHRQRSFLQVTDLIAPCVPTGLACGRIGNFINGELWGRAADPSLPWAMVFPQSGVAWPRHPSQLYQFALEGLLLFVLLWFYAQRTLPASQVQADGSSRVVWGRVSAAFLVGYGSLRFIAEYFREPDDFLGLLALSLSMGQWLCLPMIALGLGMFWFTRAKVSATPNA